MSAKDGGWFGTEHIEWFNGSLFDGAPPIPLLAPEIDIVRRVAKLDWAEIEPAIFGTLFERGLDLTGAASWVRTTPIATRSCASWSRC